MPEDRKGVTGKSLLFKIPGIIVYLSPNACRHNILLNFADFDVVKQCTPDIMHLNDLGVARNLVAMTFTGCPPRPCTTQYRRQSPDKANENILDILVSYLWAI